MIANFDGLNRLGMSTNFRLLSSGDIRPIITRKYNHPTYEVGKGL